MEVSQQVLLLMILKDLTSRGLYHWSGVCKMSWFCFCSQCFIMSRGAYRFWGMNTMEMKQSYYGRKIKFICVNPVGLEPPSRLMEQVPRGAWWHMEVWARVLCRPRHRLHFPALLSEPLNGASVFFCTLATWCFCWSPSNKLTFCLP